MFSGVPFSGGQREAFRHEASKGSGSLPADATWLERLVRYAERDDLLLYVTAFIGVIMPALVYVLYHKAHSKKEQERLEEEAERRVVTIFYGSETGKTERLAEILADEMEDYSPPIVNMASIDPEDFKTYKGVGLFLISTRDNGKPPESVEWFMEWMDDVDSKTKRKANFRHIRFCIFGVGDSRFGPACYNKAAKILSRRLRSLGAKPLCAMAFADEKRSTEIDEQLRCWSDDVCEVLEDYITGGRSGRQKGTTTESEYDSEDAKREKEALFSKFLSLRRRRRSRT
uniref:Flavodoxin-like domain-containing protein n=1 Tax=Steinernema glaseri TaxID=37863 RepID=A0A1I8AWI7_9BILA